MLVLVIGRPGTGKSTAIGANKHLGIKGLDPSSTFIIKPNSKPLPFPGSKAAYNKDKKNLFATRDMKKVHEFIGMINSDQKHIKTIVIEDITHYFNHKEKSDSAKKGFDKWTDMANEVSDMIIGHEVELRDDLDIIVIGHTENQSEGSDLASTVLQTPGKMLDRKVMVQSYFTYILHTSVTKSEEGIKYTLLTNADGSGREAKSPPGALELFESNDYGLILEKIHKYHG